MGRLEVNGDGDGDGDGFLAERRGFRITTNQRRNGFCGKKSYVYIRSSCNINLLVGSYL